MTRFALTIDDTSVPEDAGFRPAWGGLRSARTMMLEELTVLLATVPSAGRPDEYVSAVVEGNVLGKGTVSTRKRCSQRLRELYALDPDVPVFSSLRRLWDVDEPGRRLLACLCANARDPFLRATGPQVLGTPVGQELARDAVVEQLLETTHGRYGERTLGAIAGSVRSSWTQSGHLRGRVAKIRTRAMPTPGSTAYALYLGRLCGRLAAALTVLEVTENTVVAVLGSASLFGFIRVSELLEATRRHIRGRLLVFFPGAHEGQCYRLLSGQDSTPSSGTRATSPTMR